MEFKFSDLSIDLNNLLVNNPYYTGSELSDYIKNKDICKRYQDYLESYQESYSPTVEEVNIINEIIAKEVVFFQNDIISYYKKNLDFIATIHIKNFGTYYIDKQNENYILYSDIDHQIFQYKSDCTYISNNEYSNELLEIDLNSTFRLKINRNQEFTLANKEYVEVAGYNFSYHYYNGVKSLYGFANEKGKTIYNYTRNYDNDKEKLVFLIKYKDNSIKLLHVENKEEYSITYSFYLHGAKINLFKNHNKKTNLNSFSVDINDNIRLSFLDNTMVEININEEVIILPTDSISDHLYLHGIKDIKNEYLIQLSNFLNINIFEKIFNSLETSFSDMNNVIPNDKYLLDIEPFKVISKKMLSLSLLLEKPPEQQFKNILKKEIICYNNKNK